MTNPDPPLSQVAAVVNKRRRNYVPLAFNFPQLWFFTPLCGHGARRGASTPAYNPRFSLSGFRRQPEQHAEDSGAERGVSARVSETWPKSTQRRHPPVNTSSKRGSSFGRRGRGPLLPSASPSSAPSGRLLTASAFPESRGNAAAPDAGEAEAGGGSCREDH